MELNTIVYLSCGLTALTMLIIGGFLFFLLQIGTRGVRSVFGNFMGGNDDQPDEAQANPRPARAQAAASSSVLRQRAQNLDFDAAVNQQGGSFNPQAQGAFGAQATPSAFDNRFPNQQSAQFTAQNSQNFAPPANTQPQQGGFPPQQPSNLSQRFGDQLSLERQPSNPARPSTPSLSSPRPMSYTASGNSEPLRPGTQPLQSNSFNPQQPPANRPNVPQRPSHPQQNRQQPLQSNFNRQPQRPGGNFPPPPNAQQAAPPNQQQGAPPPPGQPQQGGLGQPYRPSLSQGSRLGSTGDVPSAGSNLRRQRGRDSGLRDDYDRIYDDGGGGLGGFMDDIGLG